MGEDSNRAGPVVRTFDTGANRDVDEGKYDYEAFLSPLVLDRYAAYMHKNRYLRDGSVRDGDNWQKGIPRDVYMKSAWRHFMEWWRIHRDWEPGELLEDVLCATLFNVMGYLHEHLKAQRTAQPDMRPAYIRWPVYTAARSALVDGQRSRTPARTCADCGAVLDKGMHACNNIVVSEQTTGPCGGSIMEELRAYKGPRVGPGTPLEPSPGERTAFVLDQGLLGADVRVRKDLAPPHPENASPNS